MKFVYKSKDREGNDRQGFIETSDIHQASKLLSRRGLIVISLKEEKTKQGGFLAKHFDKVSFTDIVVMTRQLATMVEAGLILSDSLDILIDQQVNKKFKLVLTEIAQDVKNGLDLATSISKHPEVFPPLYSTLVKAGEQSGKLDVVLVQMATNLERDREFRSKIRGAMIYPVMVFGLMIAVMVVMMVFVVPRLVGFYGQSNIELPFATVILINLSNMFVYYWWAMILVAIGGFLAFRRWVANPSGAYQFDALLLKIPVVSTIIKGSSLTNFTRTFGLLTNAGLPILDALVIVAEVVGNKVYQRALAMSTKGVERGLLLSSQLEASGAFPRIVSQMYRVGEETGQLGEISFKLSEYFETETDHVVKNLTVIIEPVILVVLGAGVAFLVISMILPIYRLTTSFS